jgi:hypothetical protein
MAKTFFIKRLGREGDGCCLHVTLDTVEYCCGNGIGYAKGRAETGVFMDDKQVTVDFEAACDKCMFTKIKVVVYDGKRDDKPESMEGWQVTKTILIDNEKRATAIPEIGMAKKRTIFMVPGEVRMVSRNNAIVRVGDTYWIMSKT